MLATLMKVVKMMWAIRAISTMEVDEGKEMAAVMIGEYRGWNVLEAWADRSLRKWHEAGVISDTSLISVGESEVSLLFRVWPDLDISEIPPTRT